MLATIQFTAPVNEGSLSSSGAEASPRGALPPEGRKARGEDRCVPQSGRRGTEERTRVVTCPGSPTRPPPL